MLFVISHLSKRFKVNERDLTGCSALTGLTQLAGVIPRDPVPTGSHVTLALATVHRDLPQPQPTSGSSGAGAAKQSLSGLQWLRRDSVPTFTSSFHNSVGTPTLITILVFTLK